MNFTLEQKILGYLLNNLELIKRTNLKSEWFRDRTHRELAHTLLTTEKEFNDVSEIESEVREIYPKTEVTEEWLHAIKYEYIYVNDFRASVKTLEQEHIKFKTHEASLQYSEYPSIKNRELLEDWLRTMGELEIDEDDGSLKKPTDQLLYELENEVEHGLRSYPKLDVLLGAGLEPGMLFVLAGRPGTGKTAYAMNIAIEIMQRDSTAQIDFFSLEMTKVEMLKRFISRLTGINGYKFKNAKVALNNDEKAQVIKSADWINKTGLRIHDDKFKISEIDRTIRQRKHENKDNKYLAIVDYVGLVDAEDNRAQRHQQLGKVSRTLKRTGNEIGIPILLLSQLNREVENRPDKKPNLSDLRESGDLEQDASVVGLLSEHQERDTVINMNVAKNRNGMTGTMYYEFYKPGLTFTETEVEDHEN